MEVQRKRARESRAVSDYMGADATVYDEIDRNITTEFDGYDKLEATSKVTVLTTETEIVDSLMEGEKGTIFVEKTPFYATIGGQEGDTGVITTANGVFREMPSNFVAANRPCRCDGIRYDLQRR